MQSTGQCDKCQTTMVTLYEFGDRMLCKANYCFQEEVEKASGKSFEDKAVLDEYRLLINATKNVPISTSPV
jgi:hypothetical protein